ncbi:CPCC family cysteine-rich protein [Dokdonella koreensis]|uniref:CPCC family cysteine-rich protein n=1 Tax=Dokdonella koreensis TaxID=323415 RepID=UPI000A02E712|nr:CPCC family cysteine-rich protein [Dokdonella koreensis]
MTDNVRYIHFPCPCCGERRLTAVGAYEVCPVCDWEDDPAQSQDPDLAGGANAPSLNQARAQWAEKNA